VKTGAVWLRKISEDDNGFSRPIYEENEITNTTLIQIHNRLKTFLNWIVLYSSTLGNNSIDMNRHHNFPEELLNLYINKHLINEIKCGEHSINQHLLALRSYYDYLAMTGFTNYKNIQVAPKNKKQARANTKPRQAIKYLTPDLRRLLYKNAGSLRNELLLRTGGELGLRSKENKGLLLKYFMVGHKSQSGFLSLFTEMQLKPDKMEFKYLLQGKFTKANKYSGGGKSRLLYIHRTLLERFYRYVEYERPESKENTLLLNDSPGNKGTSICESSASRAFTTTKKRIISLQNLGKTDPNGQKLDVEHSHHTLRHSYGTDFFYDMCNVKNIAIDDVTPTSQIFLATAKIMGHSAKGKGAPETTKAYIRSCYIKDSFDKGIYD